MPAREDYSRPREGRGRRNDFNVRPNELESEAAIARFPARIFTRERSLLGRRIRADEASRDTRASERKNGAEGEDSAGLKIWSPRRAGFPRRRLLKLRKPLWALSSRALPFTTNVSIGGEGWEREGARGDRFRYLLPLTRPGGPGPDAWAPGGRICRLL